MSKKSNLQNNNTWFASSRPNEKKGESRRKAYRIYLMFSDLASAYVLLRFF
jgi:hypothetical protein